MTLQDNKSGINLITLTYKTGAIVYYKNHFQYLSNQLRIMNN
ncbi:MAG: hypothetical protein AAF208_04680 [Cyanobacteria bacterium P01_A01_bin.45]